MSSMNIAAPTELTDAQLDFVSGGHGSLVEVEVEKNNIAALNNINVLGFADQEVEQEQ